MASLKRMCIGTAQLGMKYGIANKVGEVTSDSALKVVKSAVENGVRFFDTAHDYGRSEEVLGSIIGKLGIGSDVQIITKLPNDFDYTNTVGLEEAVERSVRRLKVETLWALLFHRAPRQIGEIAADKIARLKSDGIIGRFGVSVYHPDEAIRFLNSSSVDVVQVPFNLLDRRWIDRGVFDLAVANGKEIFIRSVFLQGLVLMNREELNGKGMAWADRYLSGIRSFAEQHELSVPLFAMQTVLQSAPQAKVIVGVESSEQLAENLELVRAESVKREVVSSWWENLGGIPEKLVNPTLWQTQPDKKIVAVIQARMGSTRLPGKALLPIEGHPALWHIVQRLRRVGRIDEIIVATTVEKGDDAIDSYCRKEGVECSRGSEMDVLDRYYKVARDSNADYVIRVTADCPLLDPAIVTKLITYFFEGGYDHCSVAAGASASKDGFVGRFPDGLDAEIFSFRALEQAWKESSLPLHREHVTPFIWQQPDRFKLGQMKSEKDYGHLRLTVDNEEDYALVSWIYQNLYHENRNFDLQDILKLLEDNPGKLSLNKQFIGREGYERFWK